MAENRLKIRIRRMLRSCKSKHLLSDVVPTYRRHHQLFSPPTAAEEEENTAKLPFLSPDMNGRKCPPASPILNNFYKQLNLNNKKSKKAYKKCAFEDRFPDCKYVNGLFSSDDDDEEREEKVTVSSSSSSSSWCSRRSAAAAVGGSMAVVKRSSDPYNDFKRSMVEMIVEKNIFGAEDLEDLLHCFLSLNSYHHHTLIIQVFADIWEAFFSSSNHI